MAIRAIITFPDPVLRKTAKKVITFDDDLKQLAMDMGETMYEAPGIGLAANQIGVLLQIVVIDISATEEEKKFITLINAEISEGQGCVTGEEGCLSVVDLLSNVDRYQKIKVNAQDLDGNPLEFDAEDHFARVLQHEVDHLLGKLFIDRISPLKRNMYKKKMKKILAATS